MQPEIRQAMIDLLRAAREDLLVEKDYICWSLESACDRLINNQSESLANVTESAYHKLKNQIMTALAPEYTLLSWYYTNRDDDRIDTYGELQARLDWIDWMLRELKGEPQPDAEFLFPTTMELR